ncbi:hypothetical protein BH09PLA1_BH09PLA1_02250 [soil metagenome]
MPNGRGTVDCHNCRHHNFVPDPKIAPRQHAMCRRWCIELPRMEYGEYNLLCREHQPEGFAPSMADGALGSVGPAVAAVLKPRVLYAVFYNVMNDPSQYIEVQRLEEVA